MAQFFELHPQDPPQRLIRRSVDILRQGGVIVYPTDSFYALGCRIGDKSAMERIRAIRELGARHNFTLVCRDLSEITTYARIDNRAFRLLKSLTPGPYTFIHQATKQVPRRLQHLRRKTIGIRVPDHGICQALLAELDQPILSTTLLLPRNDDDRPLIAPYEVRTLLDRKVDLVIDGGFCGLEPTTVVDMMQEPPLVVRQGKGDASVFAAGYSE